MPLGLVLCVLSCSEQNAGPVTQGRHVDNSPARQTTTDGRITTNYAIGVVQGSGGTNFPIGMVASNPTNHYSVRYVP